MIIHPKRDHTAPPTANHTGSILLFAQSPNAMGTRSSQTPLTPALASLRTSTSLLNSSLSILGTGTRDLPRLSTVLSQKRHFELAPSSTLASAQSAVLAELKPEVEKLLARVESVVEKKERRGEWLRARWALGEGRLGRDVDVGNVGSGSADVGLTANSGPGRKNSVSGKGAGAGVDEAKAKRLRQKKERLSYAVERLQLQAGQRERQLRKSMAAVGEPAAGAATDTGAREHEDEEGEDELAF